jgi:hypothetical protein
MQPIYEKIRTRARQIVETFPVPDFYIDHAEANDLSQHLLNQNPEMSPPGKHRGQPSEGQFRPRPQTLPQGYSRRRGVDDHRRPNAGHPEKAVHRNVMLAHMAGLLHDVKRKKKDHAVEGAAFSQEVLQDFPLSARERDYVSSAIRNHEAFKEGIPIKSPDGVLIDGCLYDADKFRWGPDNFTDTVWDMVSFHNPPTFRIHQTLPKRYAGHRKNKNDLQNSHRESVWPPVYRFRVSHRQQTL